MRGALRAEALRWRRRFLLTWLLVALTVAALVNYGVFGPVPSPEVPDELRGTWVSDDPRYAGRELRLDSNLVTLVTGAGHPEIHPAYDVRRQVGAGVTRYYITYLVGRDEITLSVMVRAGRPGEMELANPKGVRWIRQ